MLLDDLAVKYNTDKKIEDGHGYTKYYHDYFDNIRLESLKILELGVREGWSLKLWNEYFPNSLICGIDNNSEGLCPKEFVEERIKFEIGSQDDSLFLNNIIHKYGQFDIIIDDASHISPLSIKSFEILYPTLKSNGLYIIEDLHVCEYKEYLPYGQSIKQYIKSLNLNNSLLFDDKIYFIRKI
jgi:hypothetical protein